jgi:hypothetical protein
VKGLRLTRFALSPRRPYLSPGGARAVRHVDDTERLQTVERRVAPRYWRLVKEFERLTGIPVVLNASFNENEPIVMEPRAGGDCFLLHSPPGDLKYRGYPIAAHGSRRARLVRHSSQPHSRAGLASRSGGVAGEPQLSPRDSSVYPHRPLRPIRLQHGKRTTWGLGRAPVSEVRAARAAQAERPPVGRPLLAFSTTRFAGSARGPLLRRLLALADALAVLLAAASFALAAGLDAALWPAAVLPVWIVLAKLHGLYDRDHRSLRHLTVDELPVIFGWR